MIANRTYTLNEMAVVLRDIGADYNASMLRTWINRGLVTGEGPEGPNKRTPHVHRKPGKHASYTFFTLTEFALAVKLKDHLPYLEAAFELASQYAHIGSFVGDTDIVRHPSFPFHHNHGETYFCIRGFEAYALLGQTALDDLTKTFDRHSPTNNTMPMVVINVSQLFRQLCGALGHNTPGNDFRNVLDDVYETKI